MDQLRSQIQQAHQGDKAAREQLIKDNYGLVYSIVKRFEHRGHEKEELFQIGTIGLMKAIDHFDTSFEVRFSTYAVPMIMGEIKRFLRDSSMLKVSRSLKENGWEIRKMREKLEQQTGKEPTLTEIASALHMPMETIVEALEANDEVGSLYQPVYQKDGNELCLADQVASKENPQEKLINQLLLEQLLAELTQEERELIEMRYFEEKTQTQVAEQFGVSQVQVSRLEKKILQKMRNKV